MWSFVWGTVDQAFKKILQMQECFIIWLNKKALAFHLWREISSHFSSYIIFGIPFSICAKAKFFSGGSLHSAIGWAPVTQGTLRGFQWLCWVFVRSGQSYSPSFVFHRHSLSLQYKKCGTPRMKEQVNRKGLRMQEQKKKPDPYRSLPSPSPDYNPCRIFEPSWVVWPVSPPTIYKEKTICLTLLPPSIHNWPNQQMTHKTPNLLLIPWLKKNQTKDPHQGQVSLIIRKSCHCAGSNPTPNPALINFILLSFYLLSGNSFPTSALTMAKTVVTAPAYVSPTTWTVLFRSMFICTFLLFQYIKYIGWINIQAR